MVIVTPNAPIVLVAWDPGTGGLRLGWSKPAEGWVLQETDALAGSATQWTPIEGPYDDGDTRWEVVVPLTPGQRFYRLQQ